ncbi:MAG: ATP-binding protein [Saprospiraceae bacterium]|nr:ATP-binding protein [Saprospiraceae bacterium]
MKSVFKEIVLLQREYFTPPLHKREVNIEFSLPKIQTVVGPRRAGKSSLLRLSIQSLLEKGVSWDKICFISFEDERLRREPFEADIILQAFAELNSHRENLKDTWFFFDEIQYLDNWEPFVNRIHEHISKRIVITGSNSKTLHTQVSSVLRGRGLPLELLPLSFSEYLQWIQIQFESYGAGKARVVAAFHQFILRGGFPEVVLLPDHQQQSLLHEYFNAVMFRDMIDVQQPANYAYLRYLLHRVAANVGKTTSLQKIYRELKSRGYSVGQNSVYDMTQLAEDVYLHKRISKFDASIIKRENADKKSYFVDNGMLQALNNSFSDNYGMLLENAVFWQLYRQYGSIYTTDIYYFKDAYHECDFVLYKEGGYALPVQVCWSLQEESTKIREIRGLLKACKYADSKRGVIITSEEEFELNEDGVSIYVVPAWKWWGQNLDLFGFI